MEKDTTDFYFLFCHNTENDSDSFLKLLQQKLCIKLKDLYDLCFYLWLQRPQTIKYPKNSIDLQKKSIFSTQFTAA